MARRTSELHSCSTTEDVLKNTEEGSTLKLHLRDPPGALLPASPLIVTEAESRQLFANVTPLIVTEAETRRMFASLVALRGKLCDVVDVTLLPTKDIQLVSVPGTINPAEPLTKAMAEVTLVLEAEQASGSLRGSEIPLA